MPLNDLSDFYIPPELLLCIFSFCSPPTLASLTRTNFTCLELASPFLYRSVRLEGAIPLRKFFGDPEEDEIYVETGMPDLETLSMSHYQPSRLTPYLSLSQTHHLTFFATTYLDGLSPLSRRRLPSPCSESDSLQTLSLKTLTFSLPPHPPYTDSQIDAFPPPPANRLLMLVSPEHFHFKGRHQDPSSSELKDQARIVPPLLNTIPHLPYLDISLFPWSNLRKAIITDAQILWANVLGRRRHHEPSVLPPGFDLVVDLAGSWPAWEEKMILDLALDACEVVQGEQGRGGARVTVLVESKKRKKGFEQAVEEFVVVVGGGGEDDLERVKKVFQRVVVGVDVA